MKDDGGTVNSALPITLFTRRCVGSSMAATPMASAGAGGRMPLTWWVTGIGDHVPTWVIMPT